LIYPIVKGFFMKISLKKLMLVAFVAGVHTSAHPISETTATVGGVVGGVVAGAVSMYAANEILGYKAPEGHGWAVPPLIDGKTPRLVVSGLIGAGVGGLIGYAIYSMLYAQTPTARFAAAKAIIQSVSRNHLITKEFATIEDLTSYLTAYFGTSWPLLNARDAYMGLAYSLDTARDLLSKANDEAQNKAGYETLCAQCVEYNEKITQLAQAIEPRIVAITKHEKYEFQVQLYEKYKEGERQRVHEEKLQQDALSHDSWERFKDRWHDSSKEYSKQKHQDHILNTNPNRPVMLNVG
jgi:hypothetical protein